MYDIYGKEGLSAGLEVGSTLKSTDELRQDWETFKAQQVHANLHIILKRPQGRQAKPNSLVHARFRVHACKCTRRTWG